METVFFTFTISPTTNGYSLIATAKDAQGVNVVNPLVANGLNIVQAMEQQTAFYIANNPQ